MSGHQTDHGWQGELIARYPHLFNRTVRGETYAPGYPAVGDGWRDLVETAIRRIEDAVAVAPTASVTIEQIKEKFGCLRLYWNGQHLNETVQHAIKEAVALAEARSGCTCEICGNAGVLHDLNGWFATACADHARGVPVKVKAGFENMHIVRSFKRGRDPVVTCRRYDRGTDTFIDVDPKSLGIEEDL